MLDFKITTLIIEKDHQALKETSAILQNFKEILLVGKTTSASQGLALANSCIPQLIFINVDLQHESGLDFVRKLRQHNICTDIVFLANDNRLAFESLPLEPLDFFINPLSVDLLLKMIDRLKFKLKKNELVRKMDLYTKSQSVATKRVFKQKKGIVVLRLDEIVFCKAKLASSNIKLRTGESLEVNSRLSDTLETINNSDFIRSGRSYVINLNYLRKIDKKNLKCVLYDNGKTWEVPLSKSTVRMLETLIVQPIC